MIKGRSLAAPKAKANAPVRRNSVNAAPKAKANAPVRRKSDAGKNGSAIVPTSVEPSFAQSSNDPFNLDSSKQAGKLSFATNVTLRKAFFREARGMFERQRSLQVVGESSLDKSRDSKNSLRQGVLLVQGAMRKTLLRQNTIKALMTAKKEEAEDTESDISSGDDAPRPGFEKITVVHQIEGLVSTLPSSEHARIRCKLEDFRKALEEMFAHAVQSLNGIMDTSSFKLCSRAAADAASALSQDLGELKGISADTASDLHEAMRFLTRSSENPKAFLKQWEQAGAVEFDAIDWEALKQSSKRIDDFHVLRGKDAGKRSIHTAGRQTTSSSSSSSTAEQDLSLAARCPPEDASSLPALSEQDRIRRFAFNCPAVEEAAQEAPSPVDETSFRPRNFKANESEEPAAAEAEGFEEPTEAEKSTEVEERTNKGKQTTVNKLLDKKLSKLVNKRGSLEGSHGGPSLEHASPFEVLVEEGPEHVAPLEAGSSANWSRRQEAHQIDEMPVRKDFSPGTTMTGTLGTDSPSNQASMSHTWEESFQWPMPQKGPHKHHEPNELWKTWSAGQWSSGQSSSEHDEMQQTWSSWRNSTARDSMRSTWSHFDQLVSDWQLPRTPQIPSRCDPSPSPRQMWVSALLPSVQQEISRRGGDRVTLETVCLERVLEDQPVQARLLQQNYGLHHSGGTVTRKAPRLPPIAIEPQVRRQVLVEAAQSELECTSQPRRIWHPYGRRPLPRDQVLFPLLGGQGHRRVKV